MYWWRSRVGYCAVSFSLLSLSLLLLEREVCIGRAPTNTSFWNQLANKRSNTLEGTRQGMAEGLLMMYNDMLVETNAILLMNGMGLYMGAPEDLAKALDAYKSSYIAATAQVSKMSRRERAEYVMEQAGTLSVQVASMLSICGEIVRNRWNRGEGRCTCLKCQFFCRE